MSRKQLRNSVLCLALVMVLSIALLPLKAEAQTFNYIYKSAGTLTAGTTVKTKMASYSGDSKTVTHTLYCYKITVPEKGYVKVTFVPGETYSAVHLLPVLSKCKTSLTPDKNAIMTWGSNASLKTQTFYCAVNKGTYYVTSYNSVKVKYDFYKSGNPTNFCRAKATSLAAGTYKKICYNEGYEFNRWYKISLTTKKTITVTLKMYNWPEESHPDGWVSVYDASGKRVSCSHLDGNSYRTPKQPKGTYYIRISSPSLDDIWARVCSLVWK